jgi:hypothetical protein
MAGRIFKPHMPIPTFAVMPLIAQELQRSELARQREVRRKMVEAYVAEFGVTQDEARVMLRNDPRRKYP